MQKQVPQRFESITGHLVDIDNYGRLRVRPWHTVTWNSLGQIVSVEPSSSGSSPTNATRIQTQRSEWIFPGSIDCHVHYPQTRMIGAYGKDLLDWLQRNVWPEEKKLKDQVHAKVTAIQFFQDLLRNGTTTALAFGSQFIDSMNQLFQIAAQMGYALISGPTLQDKNTDASLETNPEKALRDCNELIAKWHNQHRIQFAVTPRFSPACSDELLDVCRVLLEQPHQQNSSEYNRAVLLQTHINESYSEIEWVQQLFPDCSDYLATYEKFHLVKKQTVLAHSIHPTDDELRRMGASSCAVAHCPSSNGFLGSGTFPYSKHLQHKIRVGLGTDVGAGLSFSLWNELCHAHLMQMRHRDEERFPLTGESMLKLMTVDSASALLLQEEIGNFEIGKWADFYIYSPESISFQSSYSSSIQQVILSTEKCSNEQVSELLFQIALNRDLHDGISATFVGGQLAYKKLRHLGKKDEFPLLPIL